MSDVVGLALRDGQVDVVALRERLGAQRVVTAFSVPADEDAAASIRRQLQEAGVRRPARAGRLCLAARWSPRRWSCRPSPARISAGWSGFELERHLPFPPAEALFDFEALSSEAGRPLRVLLVAVERRSQERIRGMLRDAGLPPRLVSVAIHSLARLVTGDPARGRIVLWLEAADAELAVVVHGRVVGSRAFPVPVDPEARGRALEAEIGRTLAALPEGDRREVAEVVVGGLPPPALEVERLPMRVGIDAPPDLGGRREREPARPGRRARAHGPEGARWRTSCPTSFARARSPGRSPPRPRWRSSPSAIGVAIPAVTFVKERRALAALDASIARLAPEVQQAERLAAEVERARRELTTLRGFEEQGLHPLPVLRELTDTLPGDAWLTNLSVDRNGLELGGFANAASQLIPLLEASPGARASRVHLAGDEGSGPRAVPASRHLGAARGRALGCRPSVPASAGSSSSRGSSRIGVAGYVYVVEPLIEAHAATRELVVARRGLLARQERLVARSEAYGRELGTLRDRDRPPPRAAPGRRQGAGRGVRAPEAGQDDGAGGWHRGPQRADPRSGGPRRLRGGARRGDALAARSAG